MATICLLHPGAMGATVGTALRSGDHDVRWVSEGRSETTHVRATRAGLLDAGALTEGLRGADVVVSVCPPAAALEVAEAVVTAGFAGTYVDANAVAPSTVRSIQAELEPAGVRVVDGGIVGPPAERPGTTRLFLSGQAALVVAGLFAGSALEPIVVHGPVGAASATKVAYAAWTKGSAALLLAIAAYAEAEGVTSPLRAEWARSQPDLADRLALVAAGVTPKAWRFSGELADSGRAFAEAGLPEGFGRAAAEIYERLADFRDVPGLDVEMVVAALNGTAVPGSPEE